VNIKHGGERTGWPAGQTLGIITGYLVRQVLPGNQLVHPHQKDHATGLATSVVVLTFREGDLIHAGNVLHAVGYDRIIDYFGELFRVSPTKSNS